LTLMLSFSLSTHEHITQVSVLGPLLFLLYINDMPDEVLNSDCRLYVDDTLLCYDIQEGDCSPLQEDVNILERWSILWCMPFNADKCQHMQVGKEVPDFRLILNQKYLPITNEIKYLGVLVNSSLKWDGHIDNIEKQASKKLGMIRRCLEGANSETKILAFNTVVRPILEYATQVWSLHIKKQVQRLDKIHRRALRWIFRMKKTDCLSDVMKANDIKSLEDRRNDLDIHFLRRIEFGLYDIYLENYIQMNQNYDTRHRAVAASLNLDTFKYHFYNRNIKNVKVLIASRYSE